MIETELKQITSNETDDKKINKILLKFFFNDGELEEDYEDNIVDGSNDKGIDFAYYDKDNSELSLCQSKYYEHYTNEQLVSDFRKMIETVIEYRKFSKIENSNNKLKSFLSRINNQNDIDDVKDIKKTLYFFLSKTKWSLEQKSNVLKQLNKKLEAYDNNYIQNIEIKICDQNDIDAQINSIQNSGIPVKEQISLDIYKPKPENHFLEYENNQIKSIIFITTASSLYEVYQGYHSKGLLSLNLRYYFRNKDIDQRIKNTIEKNPDNFWFLNNGITITCDDFKIDGTKIKFTGGSILNGGQTTYLIWKYFKNSKKNFHIQCRLMKIKNKNNNEKREVMEKISESTNSQKPIRPRDLKSNSYEMIQLKNILLKEKWDLEIKKGQVKNKTYENKITNEELGQLIRSFIYQEPGSARSKKAELFTSEKIYSKIYKKIKILQNKDYIISILEINKFIKGIDNEIRIELKNNPDKLELFNNAKYCIISVIGLLSKLINEEFTSLELRKVIKEPHKFHERIESFKKTGLFFTNYKNDDIKPKMINFIHSIMDILYRAFKHIDNNSNLPSNVTKRNSFYEKYVVVETLDHIEELNGKKWLYEIGPLLKFF